MQELAEKAIQESLRGVRVFCKFLSANDTGETGAHQAGVYIPKQAASILFDAPCERGTNVSRMARIQWNDGPETDTRFIYYGEKTRNEYRITRGFPGLCSEHTGALFVLVKRNEDEIYAGFILNTDDEINAYLDAFGLTPAETNALIQTRWPNPSAQERLAIRKTKERYSGDFPPTYMMAHEARLIDKSVNDHEEKVISAPDEKLIDWLDIEYRLFSAFELDQYCRVMARGIGSLDDFIATANAFLNRRKSRAGKSLEHHLEYIFEAHRLECTPQAQTEGNKRPDFIFPSEDAYHDMRFPADRLVLLGAKTTCKDRWRQILTEADRLRGRTKFLCTLQQGVSSAQMREMEQERVVLVVPEPYIHFYPSGDQGKIFTIKRFIEYVHEKES